MGIHENKLLDAANMSDKVFDAWFTGGTFSLIFIAWH